MFTGIIETTARVIAFELYLKLEIPESLNATFSIGESVAVNGTCLTVAEISQPNHLDFFVAPETLKVTQLGTLQTGSPVNIERAVLPTTRMSGHYVSGHIDGLATLLSISQEGESKKLDFSLPPALHKYCIYKGSIALNGVSLTINEVFSDFRISVQIIPHTWNATGFSCITAGDLVNVEVDLIAKYVERLCQTQPQ